LSLFCCSEDKWWSMSCHVRDLCITFLPDRPDHWCPQLFLVNTCNHVDRIESWGKHCSVEVWTSIVKGQPTKMWSAISVDSASRAHGELLPIILSSVDSSRCWVCHVEAATGKVLHGGAFRCQSGLNSLRGTPLCITNKQIRLRIVDLGSASTIVLISLASMDDWNIVRSLLRSLRK
jgi:hypothetical protein